jgi:type II secretory pathway component PulM
MLQRLAALSPRERWLAAGGSVFVIVYGLYLLVYNPVATEKAQLDNKINAQQLIFQQLTRVGEAVRSLRTTQQQTVVAADGQSLTTAIESSSTQLALKPAIKSLLPEGADQITVVIEAMPFDQLAYWLALLETKQGISVAQMSISRDKTVQGTVDGRISLRSH